MQRIQNILNASFIWHCANAVGDWFGKQWERSFLVHIFLAQSDIGRTSAESSVFYRLFLLLQWSFARLYKLLRLDKLLCGSIFLNTFMWATLSAVLAPFVPTMVLLALVLVTTLSLAVAFVRDPSRRLAHSPMNRYIILYAVVYLTMAFFSVTPRGSLPVALLTVAFVLFAVVLQNAVTSQKMLDTLIHLVVFAGTAVALYGIYQYVFRAGYQSSAWVDSDMFSEITFRVPSTFGNPNMLGQYFILTIPLAGACLLGAKNWTERAIWLVCCGLMAICMLMTFSRGAWLGLLFAGAVFFLLLRPRLMMLAPVLLVVLYFTLPDSIISRFTSIGDLGDASTSYRVFIWMGTIAMLKHYWFSGIGPGEAAYSLIYPAYSYSGIVAPHSHNLFLQIMCDGGIVTLVIFLLILFHYFRTACVAIYRGASWQTRLFQLATCAGIAGFMVQAMTDYSFYNYRVMFLFWTIIGLGALSVRRDTLPATSKKEVL